MRIAKQRRENFGYLLTANNNYGDRIMMPSPEAPQRAVDTQREVGHLKARLDVARFAELSYVKEAAERAKK